VEITPATRDNIERECTRLLVRSLRYFDQCDWRAYAALFAENGILIRANLPNEPLQGRAAIEAALKTRPTDRLTRHHCSNIDIQIESPSRATGSCYALVAAANIPTDAANRPLNGWPADGSFKSGEYNDEYECVGGVWQIAKRTGLFTVGSPTQ
jgi:SnoaL-like domain